MLEQFNGVIAGLKKNYQNLPEAIDQLDDHLTEMIKKINSGKDVAETISSAKNLINSLRDDLSTATAQAIVTVTTEAGELIDTVQGGLQNIEDGLDAAQQKAQEVLDGAKAKSGSEGSEIEESDSKDKASDDSGTDGADSDDKKSKKNKSKE